MVDWKSYVIPQLLALVPFLIGVTEVVKGWLFSDKALELKAKGQEGTARRIAYKVLPSKGRLVDQLLAFPAGGFDDQVDSFCMAVLATKKRGGSSPFPLDGDAAPKDWRRMANI